MKNIIILLFIGICGLSPLRGQQKEPVDWQMKSYDKDGVYGAEVYKAYEYLKNREPKQKIIVAVIDEGVDTGHEDLRASLWTNPGEIPGNGIDDDKNGYVDDVHGWNFLGMPDGSSVTTTSLEADRCYFDLKERFENVDTNRLSKKDLVLYRYYKNELSQLSNAAVVYRDLKDMRSFSRYGEDFDRELKAKYPGVELGREHFESILDKDEKDQERVRAYAFYVDRWKHASNYSWKQMFDLRVKLLDVWEKRYKEACKGIENDRRGEMGDDMKRYTHFYGNGTILPAMHGSHVAGIIGATRDNGLGIDGIADVQLMCLRIGTGDGDEYDKDVANAVRYAVMNGAKIINMSFGKYMSPRKGWVYDALKLAEKKGVLVVHAAGNSAVNIDGGKLYPNKHVSPKKTVRNFITVGATESNGSPFVASCYGKEEVDLYAPGAMITSTVPENSYKPLWGTSMATPVVTGVAALIWNYFPDLTATQVKQAILEGVTSREGAQVSFGGRMGLGPKVTCDFADLCVTGGIVNALGAVKIAEQISKKK